MPMSAKQLIDAAAACVHCGKAHQPRMLAGTQQRTWLAKDGHPYAPRLFEMTGRSADPVLAALRALAKQGDCGQGKPTGP